MLVVEREGKKLQGKVDAVRQATASPHGGSRVLKIPISSCNYCYKRGEKKQIKITNALCLYSNPGR